MDKKLKKVSFKSARKLCSYLVRAKSVVWLEMAGTDETSKIEHFGFFRGMLDLGCLICSIYATAYLTTFCYAVFSGVTITGISEVDSFSIILYGF